MRKLLCLTLAACLLGTSISGCGKIEKSESIFTEESADHAATLVFPEQTDIEKLASLNGSAAIQSYLVARTYLEDFLDYDIENGNLEEYNALLEKTIKAFEQVEILSESLKEVSDAWIESDKMDRGPTLAEIGSRMHDYSTSPFMITAYAAVDNPAVAWAKDITKRFDQAPAGRGVRTLAEHLGTDCKRAYAQLKQAQDILAGASYEDIANTANKAYQTATVLKTAGTAAGFVIAVAAAPATTTLGAAISTGGTVISGVNTLLEVGSTGAVLTTNGEGNWVSDACDKTEAQLAPIGAVFSVAGVATNVAGFMKNTDSIIKESVEAGKTTKEILTAIGKSTDVADDAFGMITFSAGALTEVVNDNQFLGGTFKINEKGEPQFTMFDTILGTTPENNGSDSRKGDEIDQLLDAVERVKKNFNVFMNSKNGEVDRIDEILENMGIDNTTFEKSYNRNKFDGNIPKEIRENIRRAAPVLDPGSPEFDPVAAESFIKAIAAAVEKAKLEAETVEETETEEETETTVETVEEVPEDTEEAVEKDELTSEGKWVEPYEYFGVKDSIELLPKLRENHITKLEVVPIIFHNKTRKVYELSNPDPFILDISDGAVTEYSTHFVIDWMDGLTEDVDLTLTFTGGRGAINNSYWSINGIRDRKLSNGNSEVEELEDGILYFRNLERVHEEYHKYIIMDVGMADFFGLEVKKILIE